MIDLNIISLHILIPDREYTTEDVLADEDVNVHKSAIYNILVEDLYWNEELLTSFNDEDFILDDYTENIRYISTGYKQMDKNTVRATHPSTKE